MVARSAEGPALGNDASVVLMTSLPALRHREPGATVVLLRQQLGVISAATERRAVLAGLVGLAVARLAGLLRGLLRDLLPGALRRGADAGLHFRFHVHPDRRAALDPRGQAIPVLPEMLLGVAEKRVEHVRGVARAHRAHRVRTALLRVSMLRWRARD